MPYLSLHELSYENLIIACIEEVTGADLRI
jgi:hypothetical protein